MDDVNTLLHEAGHAFHAFASHAQPLIWQRHPGSEAAELASMSMELLAAPHLTGPGGFYRDEEGRLAEIEHLEDVLIALPHIASVDAFQHWIYTSGEGRDAAARDAAWLRIRSRFERGVDWTGLGSGTGGPLVPAAAHLPLPVLLHRVRPGAAGRAPGVAQQLAGSRRGRAPLPRGAGAGRHALAAGHLRDRRRGAHASMPPRWAAWWQQVEERIAELRAGLPERG